MTDLRIGAHVDQEDPVGDVLARGGRLAQIFLGDPQSYKGPVIRYADGAAALKAAAEAADIDLYVHAPYPINVAATNNRIRIPGRKLLQQHLHGAAEIGAKGVIVHGGHLGKDEGAAAGRHRSTVGRDRGSERRRHRWVLPRHLPRPCGWQ